MSWPAGTRIQRVEMPTYCTIRQPVLGECATVLGPEPWERLEWPELWPPANVLVKPDLVPHSCVTESRLWKRIDGPTSTTARTAITDALNGRVTHE